MHVFTTALVLGSDLTRVRLGALFPFAAFAILGTWVQPMIMAQVLAAPSMVRRAAFVMSLALLGSWICRSGPAVALGAVLAGGVQAAMSCLGRRLQRVS